MLSGWTRWPQTPGGRLSMWLGVVAIALWLSLPVFVQWRERAPFAPDFGIWVVVVVLVVSLTASILGWVSVLGRKDRSVVLLLATCVVSAVMVITVLGEVIEIVMMAGFPG